MKKTRPWERPGYTFSIGWPVGFVPMFGKMNSAYLSRVASQTRERDLDAGKYYAKGTITGLAPNDHHRLKKLSKAEI